MQYLQIWHIWNVTDFDWWWRWHCQRFWNFYCKEAFFVMLSYNLYLYESKTSIITDSKNWDHYCLICHFCGFCITIALLSTVCVSREVGLSSRPIPHSGPPRNDKWQCLSVCEQAWQLKFLQCIRALGIYAMRFIREPVKPYMNKTIHPGHLNMPDQPDHFDWSKELSRR